MWLWYDGIATLARMPTIATVIISSISVKPLCLWSAILRLGDG
jgi:hypothetical protein